MKISKIIIAILLATILIIGNTGVLYATDIIDTDEIDIKPSIQLPEGENSSKVMNAISQLLGLIRNIGIIVTVVLLTVMGFATILGSASEKAAAQSKYVGFIIGAILLTSVSAIAKMLISIAESIV